VLEGESDLNGGFLKQSGFRVVVYGSGTINKPDSYAGVMVSVTRRGAGEYVIGQAAISEDGKIFLRTGKFGLNSTPSYNSWTKIYG
jgi:hypothetical protein